MSHMVIAISPCHLRMEIYMEITNHGEPCRDVERYVLTLIINKSQTTNLGGRHEEIHWIF